VLIYAGASGVGTALIQLVSHFKANSMVLCSTEKKCEFCIKSKINKNSSFQSKLVWEQALPTITKHYQRKTLLKI